MERTKETLEARVRETPLVDRLKECRQRIGKMCSEGRPPRMCIPVQHDDDDFFISTTLSDAQATVEALQAVIRQMGEQAAVLAKDGMAAKAQVEALQRELESANALLHKKNCAIGKAEMAIEALQRERDEAIREHGKESGFWGRSCARLLDKRDELQAALTPVEGGQDE